MPGRLAGKVAVITGASRGLGRFCAIGYGREGATVVVAARTENESNPNLPGTIHETAELVREAGGEALAVACNVADFESVEAMARQVIDRYGKVDLLMTNAAIQPPGGISTMQVRHWDLEFRVNVHGSFYAIRALLPSMLEAGNGNIITISSIAAGGGSHYGATKRAIESMTIGLAGEVGDRGIAVNCLRPVGSIDTPGFTMARDPGQPHTRTRTTVSAPPDSYVEAAVLLAMQRPETCTGGVFTDAEAVKRFASPEDFERYRAMNPPNWSAGI